MNAEEALVGMSQSEQCEASSNRTEWQNEKMNPGTINIANIVTSPVWEATVRRCVTNTVQAISTTPQRRHATPPNVKQMHEQGKWKRSHMDPAVVRRWPRNLYQHLQLFSNILKLLATQIASQALRIIPSGMGGWCHCSFNKVNLAPRWARSDRVSSHEGHISATAVYPSPPPSFSSWCAVPRFTLSLSTCISYILAFIFCLLCRNPSDSPYLTSPALHPHRIYPPSYGFYSLLAWGYKANYLALKSNENGCKKTLQ